MFCAGCSMVLRYICVFVWFGGVSFGLVVFRVGFTPKATILRNFSIVQQIPFKKILKRNLRNLFPGPVPGPGKK